MQEPAAEQHGLTSPVPSSTEAPCPQQEGLKQSQQARSRAAMSDALRQTDSAELPAKLVDNLKPAQQNGAVTNGGAHTGEAAAQMNGSSATQAGSHSLDQQRPDAAAAPKLQKLQAAAPKEQKLQAAAAAGASAKSQAAATAGQSLPPPRSGMLSLQ